MKKVFVRSGIRFDYALYDPDHTFIKELAEFHVSGQLRLAPEHVSDEVLRVMGKPSNSVYQRFCKEFQELSAEVGKDQYIVPYLMSSHPGSTMKEAVKLAEFCRDMGYMPEQVQDFYPTPSTVSTCIYYTGLDPRTMKEVYCPRDPHEKAMQRALIQYRNPKNRALVREALGETPAALAAAAASHLGLPRAVLCESADTGERFLAGDTPFPKGTVWNLSFD